MTIEEWLPLMQGVLMGLVLPIDWVVRRLKRPERHRVDPVESPLPPHTGGYRTSPRPQATVPRRAPWWRRAIRALGAAPLLWTAVAVAWACAFAGGWITGEALVMAFTAW